MDDLNQRFADLSSVAYGATTIVQSADASGVSINGSGFVCCHNGRYYVITAAHVVRSSLQLAGSVDIVTFLRDVGRGYAEKIALTISAQDWFVHDKHDVAVGILQTGGELDVRGVLSVPSHLLSSPFTWRGPLPVQYYGLVPVGTEPIVIGRSGKWTSPERLIIELEDLPNAIEVALVEGSNTPGMSGGVAIVHDRSSVGVLGLVSGYWKPRMKQPEPPKGAGEPMRYLLDKLHAMNLELQARRQLIVYITPREIISEALSLAEPALGGIP